MERYFNDAPSESMREDPDGDWVLIEAINLEFDEWLSNEYPNEPHDSRDAILMRKGWYAGQGLQH